jgi:bifunctional DNase/RNase
MTTRATDIAVAHVEALNSIEVEFYAKDGPDKKVLDAWRIYVNHVNSRAGQGSAAERWVEKRKDLLVDLIYEIAQSLDYDIDKVAIKNNAYYPKGHADIESEQNALRKAALKVFSGEAPLATTILGQVEVVPPMKPPNEVMLPEGEAKGG